MKRSGRKKRRRHGDHAATRPQIVDAQIVLQASTSHSTRDDINLEPKHKIFLSHSGAQKSFVEQLCVDLERCDRHPFFDKNWDSLPKGKEFSPLIFEAIRQCQIGVVVLSEDFFTRSKWPMLELVAMSKRKEEGFIVFPIFLGISYAQFQDSSKRAEWLQLWKIWAGKDKRINIEEWMKALALLNATNAFIYKDGMSEVRFRGDILEAICIYVHPEAKWDDSNVKGKKRFCKALRKRIESTHITQNYGVIVVGLYGVGGIGKTTACKVLCNDYLLELHGRVCHVELESGSKLDLLRRVLLKLSDAKPEFVEKLEDGECRNLLGSNIHKHKVFLAIDNVSNSVESIEQARMFLNLAFKPGSVVVVTARSLGQLKCLNINESNCLEMQELDEEEAKSLFLSQIAGVPDIIDEEDDSNVMHCVKHCYFSKGEGSNQHYHPLALKVLGLQLGTLGYNPKLWVEHIYELSSRLDCFNQFHEKEHPIFSIFRASFDKLQAKDQLLLIDAALFSSKIVEVLKGIDEDQSFFNWNIFDWLSIINGGNVVDIKKRLNELKRKSLLENLGDGFQKISLHELWREFAIMESKIGAMKDRRWLWEDSGSDNWVKTSVSKCNLEKQYQHGSQNNWLWEDCESNFKQPNGCWKNLQRMCLINIDLQSLRGLDFQYYSSVTMLHIEGGSNQELNRNQELDLSPMNCLRSLVLGFNTPSFLGLKGLESLKNLRLLKFFGTSLGCIEEIENLTNLQLLKLDVHHGDRLPNLSSLTSLRIVCFEGFNGIKTVCGLSSRLSKLQYFGVSKARALLNCPGVGDALELEGLHLSGCQKLEELPHLDKLTKLRALNIPGCISLKDIVPNLGLKKLNMLDCPLKAFPHLDELEELSINFEGLENNPLCLHMLTKLHIHGWSAKGLPSSVNFPRLESLTISESMGVDELVGVQHLTSLQSLHIYHCEFKDVSVWSLFPRLEEIKVKKCDFLLSMHSRGPFIPALKLVDIEDCKSLKAFPNFKCLRNVRHLRLVRIGIEISEDEIQKLKGSSSS